MNLKKNMAVLLATVLMLGLLLAACGGGGSSGGTGSAGGAVSTDGGGGTGNQNQNGNGGNSGNGGDSGNSGGSGEKVELDFWTFWGSETRRPIIEKIIEDFNNSQDRIVVKHSYYPWGDIWTKSTAAIAAGDPPDVIINDINSVAIRADKQQVENLSEFVKRDGVQDWFYPQLWDAVLYNGEPYAIPFNTDTRFMFYNKTAFKEAGLDPENPPSTWEELEQAAQALDIKEGNRYSRIGYHPLWGNFGIDTWMINAEPNGQGYLDYENETASINTPAKVEALKWVNSWTERLGQTNVDAYKAEFGNQMADPFLSGKAPIYITIANHYTQIRDFAPDLDFGVAPVPERVKGNGHWSWGGGFVAEIPKGSKHVEEAWEFLKWLGGRQAQEYWAVKNFDIIANIEAAEAAAQSGEFDDKGKEVYQMAVDNMEWTVLTPVPLWAADYSPLKSAQIDAALLGQISAEDALAKAQEDVAAHIERLKADLK